MGSPASLVHLHFNQIEIQDMPGVNATRRRPSFRHMKTYDAFESPAGLDNTAVQSFDGTACVSATDAKEHAASSTPELPLGRVPCVSQMEVGSTEVQPSVDQEAVSYS